MVETGAASLDDRCELGCELDRLLLAILLLNQV